MDLFQTPPPLSLRRLDRFLLSLLAFWLLGGVLGIILGYEGSFLFFNRLHHPLGDAIMPHLTHLGDGVLLSSLFALIAARRDPSLVVSMLISLLLVTLVVGFAKRELFADWDRPPVVFEGRAMIHYISVQGERHYSFPSGHSAASALMMTFYAVAFAPRLGWLWALGAVVLAYTRVYIGVHFWGDILVGSLLGVLIGLSCLKLIYPWLHQRVSQLSATSFRRLSLFLATVASLVLLGGIFRLYVSYYQ